AMQDLEGNFAFKTWIPRPVHIAKLALSDTFDDRQRSPLRWRHRGRGLIGCLRRLPVTASLGQPAERTQTVQRVEFVRAQNARDVVPLNGRAVSDRRRDFEQYVVVLHVSTLHQGGPTHARSPFAPRSMKAYPGRSPFPRT